jgi:hypothetical protein
MRASMALRMRSSRIGGALAADNADRREMEQGARRHALDAVVAERVEAGGA